MRLTYGSPRFSDDLDFSLLEPINKEVFNDVVQKVVKALPEAKLSDLASKRFTHLFELRFQEHWVRMAYSIKVEISRRHTYAKREGYELKLITSPITNLQVLGFVSTLDQIFLEKKEAWEGRGEARDLFDLWFIGEKQKKGLPPLERRPDSRLLRRDLRKYLPRDYWSVIARLGEL